MKNHITNKFVINTYYDFIKKLGILFLVILVMANGIFNYIFGEIISEGLALSATLIFFISKIRFVFLRDLLFIYLAITAFIIINLILIIFSTEFIKALFLYPYFFFLLLSLTKIFKNNYYSNNFFLIDALIIFGVISSCHAILQRSGISILLSLESEIRATGLSRSSLNLTGCLLATFGLAMLVLKNSYYKLLICSVIFIGMLAAGGRGGIISCVILFLLLYYNKIKLFYFIIILISLFFLNYLPISDLLTRVFSVFNFVDDQSNLDRLNSYYPFFHEFSFIGNGVGTTSPAAGRFIIATGFESSILNTVYEIGIFFGILLAIAFFIWYKSLYATSRSLIFIFLLSLLPVIGGQQLYGIPSAFCALMLVLYVLACCRKQNNL